MPRPRKTRQASVGAVPRAPVLELNSHIPTKVAIFANRLSRAASRFYREEFGIGVVEWRLLMFIGHAADTRANRICTATDLDKGAVSRSLGALQRMGVVTVKEDGTDSRRNIIALTAKGRALHDRLVPIALERQRQLLLDVTPNEIAAFIRLIDRLQARVHGGEPGSDERPPKPPSRPHPPLKRAPRRDESPRRHASVPRG